MLGDEEGKVGVLRMEGRIFIAVAVYGNDAVGVLVYHDAVRVHAEGPHQIVILLSPIDDLGFIEFIRQV